MPVYNPSRRYGGPAAAAADAKEGPAEAEELEEESEAEEEPAEDQPAQQEPQAEAEEGPAPAPWPRAPPSSVGGGGPPPSHTAEWSEAAAEETAALGGGGGGEEELAAGPEGGGTGPAAAAAAEVEGGGGESGGEVEAAAAEGPEGKGQGDPALFADFADDRDIGWGRACAGGAAAVAGAGAGASDAEAGAGAGPEPDLWAEWKSLQRERNAAAAAAVGQPQPAPGPAVPAEIPPELVAEDALAWDMQAARLPDTPQFAKGPVGPNKGSMGGPLYPIREDRRARMPGPNWGGWGRQRGGQGAGKGPAGPANAAAEDRSEVTKAWGAGWRAGRPAAGLAWHPPPLHHTAAPPLCTQHPAHHPSPLHHNTPLHHLCNTPHHITPVDLGWVGAGVERGGNGWGCSPVPPPPPLVDQMSTNFRGRHLVDQGCGSEG